MNNEQDYIETGSKMAQALQDIIDETCKAENCQTQTERCSMHAPDLTALVDEWEQLYSRTCIINKYVNCFKMINNLICCSFYIFIF